MAEFQINKTLFKQRLKLIYDSWNKNENDWADLDAMIIPVGTNEDVMYSKYTSLQIWLFGYEITDTLMIFGRQTIWFLASKKKVLFLEQIQNLDDADLPKIEILLRDKANGDSANFTKLINILTELNKNENMLVFGTFDEKTAQNFGPFVASWQSAFESEMDSARYQTRDMSRALAILLAPKDEIEIKLLTKSSQLTVQLFNEYLKKKICEIIDADKKIKHNRLAESIEDALSNPKYIANQNESAYLEVCYAPIIQSGSTSDAQLLKFSIVSDNHDMSFDCITCFLGLRYKSYCSNIVRTFLVNPTDEQQNIYEFLLETYNTLLDSLIEGAKFSEVYLSVTAFVGEKRPELLSKLTKNLGFVCGIEFRESSFILGPKCEAIIQPNMSFVLAFGFQNLSFSQGVGKWKKNSYGMFIGDTVIINPNKEKPTILTEQAKSKLKSIAIIFDDEEDEDKTNKERDTKHKKEQKQKSVKSSTKSHKNRNKDSENEKTDSNEENTSQDDNENEESGSENELKAIKRDRFNVSIKPDQVLLKGGKALRKTVLDTKLRNEISTENKRKEKQRELYTSMNERAQERLMNSQHIKNEEKTKKSNNSYKSRSQMPLDEPDVRDLKLFVDKKYETLILPVFGMAVPFHISTIKNVSQSIEGGFIYLRINFQTPTLISIENSSNINLTNTNSSKDTNINADELQKQKFVYLKELTYRSNSAVKTSASNLNNVFRIIKDVQKRFRTREAEQKEMENLVLQDKLVLNTPSMSAGGGMYNTSANYGGNQSQSTIIRLKDLYIRPNLAQKRITGTLEAHINGFRYTSIRGDKVDILYNNVKHAFYQPCDHEMIILIHFHLKHGILLGKKKHNDIQFYTEVGEITTDLGKRQYMHDRDDLQSEQAERELRHKLNTAFKAFCDKVEVMTQNGANKNPPIPLIEFEVPFRELGFHGVPYRSTVLLQPTSSCLVNLIEWPPFVITLDEIELVHFERVQFHLKNFDAVFIFQDYTKKPVLVNAIAMNMLDAIKEWLNSCDIYYSEGIQSLNWTKIMKTILDDPQGFFENGGWNFLRLESDSEESEGEDNETDMTENNNSTTKLTNGTTNKTKKKKKHESSDEESEYRPSSSELEEDALSSESGSSAGSGSADDSDESADGGSGKSAGSSDETGSDGTASTGTDEESGKDWDELEAEAARADRQRDFNENFEERKKPSAVHSTNKSNAGKKKFGGR